MKKWLVVFELTMQGDDIAVVYFSEKLRSQITGLSKAYKNTQDSISLLQTAEGSLSAVNDMLTKGRELAVQTANDTNTENDRSQLQKEYEQLLGEIDRIGSYTEFNMIKLFDGTAKSISLQLGANAQQGQDIQLDVLSTSQLQLSNTSIISYEDANEPIVKLDKVSEKIASQRAAFGAYQYGLTHHISNLAQTRDNLASADSVIPDVDVATETLLLTKNKFYKIRLNL